MLCKIRNTAVRPVSLHLNSGRTVHLSPGLELDLEEVEIANNDMFDKLKDKKLLALVTTARTEAEQTAVTTEASPATEAEAPRKGKTKAT